MASVGPGQSGASPHKVMSNTHHHHTGNSGTGGSGILSLSPLRLRVALGCRFFAALGTLAFLKLTVADVSLNLALYNLKVKSLFCDGVKVTPF